VRSGPDRPAAGSRRAVADGPRTSTDIDGGFIAVLFTRRRLLASGLFGGLLVAAGCSGSSATQPPLINGMTPGDYRDKLEEEAQRPTNRRAKSGAGKREKKT